MSYISFIGIIFIVLYDSSISKTIFAYFIAIFKPSFYCCCCWFVCLSK